MLNWTKLVSLAAICFIGISAPRDVWADVKIGAVLSITGPASFLGDPEKKTLDIYIDDINAKGGSMAKSCSSSSMTTAVMPMQRAHLPPERLTRIRSWPWWGAPPQARRWR
jgi:hypothetical protein